MNQSAQKETGGNCFLGQLSTVVMYNFKPLDDPLRDHAKGGSPIGDADIRRWICIQPIPDATHLSRA